MIAFSCTGCGRSFTVPETYAGRKARCKTCGAEVAVPAAEAPAAPREVSEAPKKIPMRLRRLTVDAQQMANAFKDFPYIQVVGTKGEPPERYEIEYRVRGLDRGKKNQPIPREQHRVEIQLTSEYPRISPKCRMLTPIFHPNIDPATICVGDHWAAGERLVDLVIRIGEMIAYQAYNIKSPLDGEAAMWADLHQQELPTDSRSLIPPGLG